MFLFIIYIYVLLLVYIHTYKGNEGRKKEGRKRERRKCGREEGTNDVNSENSILVPKSAEL
jgi:hypothetical protein